MRKRFFILFTLISFIISSLPAQQKDDERSINPGVGLGILFTSGTTNMYLPSLLVSIPLHKRIMINANYAKIFQALNRNTVTRGSVLNLNTEVVFIDIKVLKIFMNLGFNRHRQYNYSNDNKYTTLNGHFWGFGLRVNLNDTHTFYEERRISNHIRWGDEDIELSNAMLGHYREIPIRWNKKKKHLRTKDYNPKILKPNVQVCPDKY